MKHGPFANKSVSNASTVWGSTVHLIILDSRNRLALVRRMHDQIR